MTQPQPSALPPQPLSPTDERMWATLIHAGGIVLGFIAPLIGYLVLKDRSAFVAQNAKNALNFQILITAGYVVGSVLIIVLIGLFVMLAAAVLSLVLSIIAAIAANRGETYKYPVSIPILK